MWHLEEAPGGPGTAPGDVVASYPNGAQRVFLYERFEDVAFVPTCPVRVPARLRSADRFIDRYEPLEHLRTVRTKIALAPWLG